jgi:hypothetical protein
MWKRQAFLIPRLSAAYRQQQSFALTCFFLTTLHSIGETPIILRIHNALIHSSAA